MRVKERNEQGRERTLSIHAFLFMLWSLVMIAWRRRGTRWGLHSFGQNAILHVKSFTICNKMLIWSEKWGKRGREGDCLWKGFGRRSVKVIDVNCIIFARKRSNEGTCQEQEWCLVVRGWWIRCSWCGCHSYSRRHILSRGRHWWGRGCLVVRNSVERILSREMWRAA